MYKTFTFPLKSAFALAALFILAACGGITIDLNSSVEDGHCLANPFESRCDASDGIDDYRALVIRDCANNPEKAHTVICTAAEASTNPSSYNENGAEDAGGAVGASTPKDIVTKSGFNKNSFTKTDEEKIGIADLEIVDLCTNPATADDKQCTPAVVDCINHPFSGSCQGDNVLGNLVKGGVAVSKTVILQDKRAEDCRTGSIDRALCQNLSVQKQRCAGAAFSTDEICTSVAYSVCKADAFDPLCGEKDNFAGVYFNERSDVCFDDPKNPHCTGVSGHVAVVCNEYPFDRLCTGNADYDDARAKACESDPSVSLDCPVVELVESEEEGTELEVAVDVCLDNPFGPTCGDSGYNNARKDLVKTCAIQVVTGAVTTACDTIITEAGPCLINPFDTACDANPAVRTYIAQLRSTRVAFCKNSTGLFDHLIAPLCTGAPVAKSVCRIDPFNTVCIGDNDYDGGRLSACRDGSSNQRCSNIIAGVCDNNPFDALCGYGYTDARESACRDGSASSGQCGDIIRGVCRNNPFDSLCGNGYTNARESACRDGTASSGQCGNIIAGVCDNNPFDALCGYGYTDARESACRDGTAGTGQCGDIIRGVCRSNPFDTLCGSSYNANREGACYSNPNSSRCSDTLARVCGNNPFDSLCGNTQAYLDARESACRNGSNNTQCGNVIAGVCSGNPFDPLCGSGYTQSRRSLCTDNPFAPRCAGEGYNDLRVSFCEDNVGNHASCPAPEPTPTEVTAEVWADSFDESLSHGATAEDTESQFLIGRETDLDTGGVSGYRTYTSNLNLADATFNGVALGGDRADGVAFFSGVGRTYAGILSGTNLGAPLTDTIGTAKWLGSFKTTGRRAKDFVLNVSFGTGAGAGEIKAIIQTARFYYDYYIRGEFDDAGVITGTAGHGVFKSDKPINNGRVHGTGRLTGLIGQEGAVGAFIARDTVHNSDYYGGFVARPSSAAELQTLEQTCADDPFNTLCTIGYGDERRARMELCTIGDNANNDALCGIAAGLNFCIKNPFNDALCGPGADGNFCNRYPLGGNCANGSPLYYEQARTNRLNFCLTSGNGDNDLCTSYSTQNYICTTDPFAESCLSGYNYVRESACRNGTASTQQCRTTVVRICSNNPFDTLCGSGYTQNRRSLCSVDPFTQRCAGEGYNDLRVSFCDKVANAGNPDCPQTPQVTAEVWADSFDTPLSHGATANDRKSQFLIARETDLDTGGLRTLWGIPSYLGNLNLADATFNGVALGGDRADGMAFFAAEPANNGRNYSYAGILSGTNLGAPLTDTIGSAKWIGSFKYGFHSPTDFVLNVSFGTGAGAGEIEAIIQTGRTWDFHIAGEFDDAGVITGTARSGFFTPSDPDNSGSFIYKRGKLTGLIGEEGAVGAVLIGRGYGGFVARPTSAEELRTLAQTCTDDPFNKGCTIGYESERNEILEHCIIGGNANDERCDSVNESYVCINNPFYNWCDTILPNHYEQARINRVAFCRTAGNAGNALCTVEKTFAHICTNHPFDAQCRGDNDYRPIRRNACTDNPFAPRCAGDAYNDLRVTFCENNAGNPACPRPVVPTTDRVTASDWVDSFDGNLRKTPDTNYSQIDRDPQTGRRNPDTDQYDAQSSFLESNADSLDTGTLSDSWYEQRDIRMEILNFDTATFDGKYLNGDAEDGLVFFTGVRLKTEGVINARYHSHAGIISTTDLGAPLNQTGSATWHGTIALAWLYDDDTDFSLDIVFNGAEGGTLSAFISQNARSWFLSQRHFHAKLTGTFDANGVITGTLDEGIFIDSDPNRPKQPEPGDNPRTTDVLSGLIGEEGAIGAFQGGGGFVVRPSEAFMSQAPLVNNARVTTADWLESFEVALSGAPSYRNAPTPYDIFGEDNPYRDGVHDPNEFLKGSKTGMSVRNGYGVKYKVLTLADSTLDGQSLGGDATDGLAIARDRYLGSHYASILSGTDLGAPLTQTQGTVNWYGTFRVFGWHHVNRDFELRINFGAGDSAGTLNAFVRSQHVNTYHYRINGVFDDNGVITGAVELGNFGGQDADLPTHGRKSGELRGLIGEEGAIAVFISDENNFNGFSGGFVATPDLTHVVSAAPVADTSPNRVTTSDWLESFDVVPSATLDGDLNTRFLGKEEVSTGSDVRWYGVGNRGYEWITFAPVVRSGKSEAKNIRQGAFSASSKDGKYVYFAGILPNTDLGAPLISSDVPVYWHGRFQATLPYEIKKALTLKVSFNGGANHVGEVEAFVKDSGDLYYHLKGDFDDKGVIKGTVKYGDISDRNNNPSRNGVLTGLIGQEGAAGAFVANINNGFGDYSGGFIARASSVASPTATPTPLADTTPNRVTGRDWQAGFDKVPDAVPDTISSYYTRKNQFLRSTGGTLNTGVRGDNAPDVSILTLADAAFGNNRGDATDGVAMFEGRHRYAGVLTNTDLGAPVTQTTGTAEWEGRFQTTEMDAKDFTLEIDFRNREVEAFVHRRANYYYYMTGTFDRNGLIKGAVDSGDFTDGNRETPRYHGSSHPAEMRGLIGQEGAVGVFISDTNYSGYSGGFVARPTP